MNAAWVVLFALACFGLAYRFYGRFLSDTVFGLTDDETAPAHRFRDDVDFLPTDRRVLFGHHFSSIAGAGPIVGPAIAVIWGWVPAVIWVIGGAIFIGAMHDFGALALSMKNDGRSVGDLTSRVLGERARILFLLILLFGLWLVLAVFALIIAQLFVSQPESVLAINLQILVAVGIGFLVYKKKIPLLWPSLIAVGLLFCFIWLGVRFPLHLPPLFGGSAIVTWVVILLVYAFVASVLPVWVLLQPRDYINSHMLLLGLGGMFFGLLVAHPPIVAPALNLDPPGAPSWLPFLFVTIACGSISGFHGLVSSGTTVKQVEKPRDCRFIGYGAMLGEGSLALIAILACTAGFAGVEQWQEHYATWEQSKGLAPSLGAFVAGTAGFLGALGLPITFATSAVAVLVIAFAATSMDTACRIQRLIIAELGTGAGLKWLGNRYVASGLAAGSALVLALAREGGKGGLILWPLFGTTNQLIGGMTLLVLSAFLLKKARPSAPVLIPMVFLVGMTLVAMVQTFWGFYEGGNRLLVWVAGAIIALQLWFIGEALHLLHRRRAGG